MSTVQKNDKGQYDYFAWPGGYQIIYDCADGGCFCAKCANENAHLDTGADDPQWHIVGAGVYWEGAAMHCDNCNEVMESEYGDPDSPED